MDSSHQIVKKEKNMSLVCVPPFRPISRPALDHCNGMGAKIESEMERELKLSLKWSLKTQKSESSSGDLQKDQFKSANVIPVIGLFLKFTLIFLPCASFIENFIFWGLDHESVPPICPESKSKSGKDTWRWHNESGRTSDFFAEDFFKIQVTPRTPEL